MTQHPPNLLLLVAVVLPPRALNALGTFVEERTIETPYGPVGPLALRALDTNPGVWVQPYSGLPTRTDPRATIYAAKMLGTPFVLNWDTGVAINPMLRRGQPMIPMDFIDFTRQQPQSFSIDDPSTGSQSFGHSRASQSPTFSPQLTAALSALLPDAPAGIYLGIDGPRRETAAEARMYRAWGVDVAGQNLVPEVSLAYELGIEYAGLVTVAHQSMDQSVTPSAQELREGLELVSSVLPQLSGWLEKS